MEDFNEALHRYLVQECHMCNRVRQVGAPPAPFSPFLDSSQQLMHRYRGSKAMVECFFLSLWRRTSFFLYLMPSFRQPTAPVTCTDVWFRHSFSALKVGELPARAALPGV